MKIIFWLLFAVGCIYVFYSGGMTVWSYLEVKGVVEDVVAERAPKSDRMYRANQVKEDIAKRVAASGIKVDDREISVEDEGKTLDVRVRWNWPVIVYKGDEIWGIPMTHERTFQVPEKR
jgi:hypothetical protein